MSGRVFVCGDLHGCLDELEFKLRVLGFDKTKDKLFALGDLVDRGPKSAECVRLLNEPWFASIKGNHEVLMEEANKGNAEMHVINGGGWFALLDQPERDELVALVTDLPVAMTVTTPSGRKIGLVHAEPVGNDWPEFLTMIDRPSIQDMAMWNRDRVRKAPAGLEPMRGVDMVYMGHTPLREPLQSANLRWIDTGCFATGNLTVEELQ
nr:serine/threonine protein phosphatase [uncultured bacterium]